MKVFLINVKVIFNFSSRAWNGSVSRDIKRFWCLIGFREMKETKVVVHLLSLMHVGSHTLHCVYSEIVQLSCLYNRSIVGTLITKCPKILNHANPTGAKLISTALLVHNKYIYLVHNKYPIIISAYKLTKFVKCMRLKQ